MKDHYPPTQNGLPGGLGSKRIEITRIEKTVTELSICEEISANPSHSGKTGQVDPNKDSLLAKVFELIPFIQKLARAIKAYFVNQ